MTAATWHFYDQATGLFSGASFSGSEAELAQQLAHRGAGVGAHAGAVDHLSQKIDLATGAIIDHKPDPPWDGTDLTLYVWWWDASARRWKLRPRLKKLRADKWAQIKAARDADTDSPLVTPLGAFDHDADSRAAIAAQAQVCAATGDGVSFTLADNTVATLSAEEMRAVWLASDRVEQLARAQAAQLRAQIQAASAAQLDAIAWAHRSGGLADQPASGEAQP